jgi:hypothetical protein
LGAEGVRDRRVVSQPGRDGNWQDAPSCLGLGVFALVLSERIQQCPASGHRNGVSQDIGMPGPARSTDVEGASCHHRRGRREPVPGGGGPGLRGVAGMGVAAGGPVPSRGRGGIRAPVTPPENLPVGDPRDDGGADRRAAQGAGGRGLDAGPHTIAWHLLHHHQVRVSPATVSRYLPRADLVTPSRPGGRARLTCGSPPSSPAIAGRPTSPTTARQRHRDRDLDLAR